MEETKNGRDGARTVSQPQKDERELQFYCTILLYYLFSFFFLPACLISFVCSFPAAAQTGDVAFLRRLYAEGVDVEWRNREEVWITILRCLF